MLASKKIVILEKREKFNVNHKTVLGCNVVQYGTVSSQALPQLVLHAVKKEGESLEDSITCPVT